MYEKRKLLNFRLVQEIYGRCKWDDLGYSWLYLQRLPLPPGRWNKRYTGLLLEIPDAFPEVPPTHFYVDKDLRDRRGRKPGHYFEENAYSSLRWAYFCLHLEGSWRPAARIEDGDNLVTVIDRIQVGLTGGQRHGE